MGFKLENKITIVKSNKNKKLKRYRELEIYLELKNTQNYKIPRTKKIKTPRTRKKEIPGTRKRDTLN